MSGTLYPRVLKAPRSSFILFGPRGTGTIPVVFAAPDREEALRAYVQTYLKEEIQAEALVRNLPGFARFLPVAALFHGQILNASALARDAGVARMTVEGFLGILEDTLLAFRLPAFEGRLRVREKRHPKLYWVDPGLARAARKGTGPLAAAERGALLEGWVASLLRARGDLRREVDEMTYWAPADASRTEVDFLLRKGDRFAAVDVKSSRRLSGDDFRGLRAIAELKGLDRRILVAPVPDPLRTEDGIEIPPAAHLAQGAALFSTARGA